MLRLVVKCLGVCAVVLLPWAAANALDEQAIKDLTEAQLSEEIDFAVSALSEAKSGLAENGVLARRNTAEIQRLEFEDGVIDLDKKALSGDGKIYNDDVAQHDSRCNRFVQSEHAAAACASSKQGLDQRLAVLDSRERGVNARVAALNIKITGMNQEEDNRAWAAAQWIKAYERHLGTINMIEAELEDRAVFFGCSNDDLCERTKRSRQCAAIADPDCSHQCLQTVMDGAPYPLCMR